MPEIQHKSLLQNRYNFEYVAYLKGVCEELGSIPTTMLVSLPLTLSFRGMTYSISIPSSVSTVTRKWSNAYVQEINIIVTNLVAGVKKAKCCRYSRNRTANKKNRYNKKRIQNTRIIKAIEYLESVGYCTNIITSSKQDPRKPRMSSFIVPTQKFIDEFCSDDEAMVLAEHAQMLSSEVIILRDVDGNDIDYKDTALTEEARALVIKLNTISYNSVFKKRDGSLMDNFVVRIFSLGDFGYGGRYARSDYQNMPNKEDERLYTTIDDEQVIEIDFSNLHIRMLTDLRGVDHTKFKDDDLYHMPLDDNDLNRDNRWLIKQAVNIMFNTSSDRAAMSAIQDKIRHNPANYCFSGPKEVVTAIKASYPWLADDFCQPIPRGHYLMNMDSWIAHDVGKVFAELNTPIGIIHDSFIVKAQYRDNLIKAMADAYRKRVKNPVVKVHLKMKWVERNPLVGDKIIEQSFSV